MRAKTINEYNFERGKDPKTSMGIGRWKDGYVVDSMGEYPHLDMGISKYIHFNNYEWVKNATKEKAIDVETEVTPEIEEELSKLPVLTFKKYSGEGGPMGLLDDWPEDFPFRKIPFVANVLEDEDRSFLVNPEGFNFARYITELV